MTQQNAAVVCKQRYNFYSVQYIGFIARCSGVETNKGVADSGFKQLDSLPGHLLRSTLQDAPLPPGGGGAHL